MLSGAALSGGSSVLRGQQPAGPAVAPRTPAQKSSQPDIAPDVLLLRVPTVPLAPECLSSAGPDLKESLPGQRAAGAPAGAGLSAASGVL